MQRTQGTIARWLWSELENTEHEAHDDCHLPVAREYSVGAWEAHHYGTHALVRIKATLHQIEAAKQDHRVTVLPSIYSREPIPAPMAAALQGMGVTPEMSLAECLEKLGEREPR